MMADPKVILAYGDSLTYGANPVPGGPRHPYEDRWPTVLERGLGGAARVIPEGLGGRTTIFDDWNADADRNGARVLPTLLSSHSPIDLVIIMLGTNDLKPFLGRTAQEASNGARRLVQIIRAHAAAEREAAPAMQAALQDARARLAEGKTIEQVELTGRAALERAGFGPIDYFEVRKADTLQRFSGARPDGPVRLLAAAKLGRTRLIDNIAG